MGHVQTMCIAYVSHAHARSRQTALTLPCEGEAFEREMRMSEPKRTRSETQSHAEMMIELMDIETDIRNRHLKRTIMPEDWSTIAAERPVPKKARMTTLVDEDVLRWFRRHGPGYQARVNRVLRAFMLSVISKELAGAYTTDWKGDPI